MLISRSAPPGAAAGRVGAWLSGFGFLASAGVAVHVARSGPVEFTLQLPSGALLGAWQLDAVAVVGLLLVTGLATVIQAFAINYLRGDRRAPRFAGLAGALTLTSAAMVAADTLLALAIAWTLSSVLLCALLGLYRERAEARAGVRRTAIAFGIGDAALWGAVVIVSAQWGQVTLAELGALVDGATLTALAASLLVVVAAMARSAQLPFQAWLPATLAAPTPVSALLHAGAVNAGGLLLIKLSPLVAAVPLAMWSTALIGAATLVYGAVLMLARPDVKGALAHSTVAQMGFMVMTCGLGAYAAALVHLVAHGMYKANLFLGSGGAIAKISAAARPSVSPPGPTQRRKASVGLLAAVIPGATLLMAYAALYPRSSTGAADSASLLVFAWLTGAWVAYGWLAGSRSLRRVVVLTACSTAAAAAYVGLLAGAQALVAPSIEAAGPHHASALLLLPVLAVLVAVALLRSAPNALGHRAGAALYAAALRTGPTVRPSRPRPARATPRAWRPLAFPVAVQRQESH